MFLCRPDHKLCRIRRQPVITVHKLEICSLCPFNSLISRVWNPGIFFVDHHHTLIRLRIRITDRAWHISAPIIYEDQFKISIFLSENTVHTAVQEFFRIVDRNNYTDGRFHSPPPFSIITCWNISYAINLLYDLSYHIFLTIRDLFFLILLTFENLWL